MNPDIGKYCFKRLFKTHLFLTHALKHPAH